MDWYAWIVANLMICTLLVLFLFISIILYIIFLGLKKKKTRNVILALSIVVVISLVGHFLYIISHLTYFRYNDWFIVGNSKEHVREKYGDFLYDTVNNDGSGVAEYRGNDSSHTYCMEYNTDGIIVKVYYYSAPGG